MRLKIDLQLGGDKPALTFLILRGVKAESSLLSSTSGQGVAVPQPQEARAAARGGGRNSSSSNASSRSSEKKKKGPTRGDRSGGGGGNSAATGGGLDQLRKLNLLIEWRASLQAKQVSPTMVPIIQHQHDRHQRGELLQIATTPSPLAQDDQESSQQQIGPVVWGTDDPSFPDYLRHIVFVRKDVAEVVGGTRDGWLRTIRTQLQVEFCSKGETDSEPDFWTDIFAWIAARYGRTPKDVLIEGKLKGKRSTASSSSSSSSSQLGPAASPGIGLAITPTTSTTPSSLSNSGGASSSNALLQVSPPQILQSNPNPNVMQRVMLTDQSPQDGPPLPPPPIPPPSLVNDLSSPLSQARPPPIQHLYLVSGQYLTAAPPPPPPPAQHTPPIPIPRVQVVQQQEDNAMFTPPDPRKPKLT